MKRITNRAASIAGFFAAAVSLVMALFSSCATGGAVTSPETGSHGHVSQEEAEGHSRDEGVREGESGYALTEEFQEITTPYAQLWSSDTITVKAGVPVRWYVEAAPGSLPKMGMACGKTIKIPGLGWGTDSHNDAEGHLTLVEGKNFVYEFTPAEPGEILFTCWMGSECHYNYIHVTAGGVQTSDASQPPRSGGETRKIVFRYRHNAGKLQT